MRPSNITDGKAGRQIGRVTTYTKRGSIAGTTGIAGGMSTTASGAPTVIGMIETTIAMTADRQCLKPGALRRDPGFLFCALLFLLAHLHGEVALVSEFLD